MSKLTKEEKLLFSLSAIKEVIESFDIDIEVTITKNDDEYTINAYKEIQKCVVDYVNSLQPLKFEELKDEMWVWDNKEKKYIKSCNNFDTEEYGKGIRVQIGFDLVRYPYEENRFYRKQVEEWMKKKLMKF